MAEKRKPKVGEIWEDADPRSRRRELEIVSVEGGKVKAQVLSSGGRTMTAKIERFNGRSNGYRFKRQP